MGLVLYVIMITCTLLDDGGGALVDTKAPATIAWLIPEGKVNPHVFEPDAPERIYAKKLLPVDDGMTVFPESGVGVAGEFVSVE
jgi:hypothetical protein